MAHDRALPRTMVVAAILLAAGPVAADVARVPHAHVDSLGLGELRSTPTDSHRGPSCPPYLGLEPPGRTPAPFAPGSIDVPGRRLHGALAVSPVGDRICWSVVPPAVVCLHCRDGRWSGPDPLPLPGAAVQAPAFSPDGRRLYYQAVDPGGAGGLDLWWADARRETWSEATRVGPPVNTPDLESQPTVTADGDLFFTATMAGVGFERGIHLAARTGDGFAAPEALPRSVNSPAIDYCPHVAADGRTLLFASSRGREGEDLHLHVAHRGPDGRWTEPVDLHPFLRWHQSARFPSLSPDGRFLFFLSGGRIWWVDATVLPEPERPSR